MTRKRFLAGLTLSGVIAVFSASPSWRLIRLEPRTNPSAKRFRRQPWASKEPRGKCSIVTANIESYSTPEDQQALIAAFKAGGHDALVKTLSKMKSKGRVAITGRWVTRSLTYALFRPRMAGGFGCHGSSHPVRRGLRKWPHKGL